MGEYQQGDLEKLEFLLLPIFHQTEKDVFQNEQKWKLHFLKRPEKSTHECWRNNFWDFSLN